MLTFDMFNLCFGLSLRLNYAKQPINGTRLRTYIETCEFQPLQRQRDCSTCTNTSLPPSSTTHYPA